MRKKYSYEPKNNFNNYWKNIYITIYYILAENLFTGSNLLSFLLRCGTKPY